MKTKIMKNKKEDFKEGLDTALGEDFGRSTEIEAVLTGDEGDEELAYTIIYDEFVNRYLLVKIK